VDGADRQREAALAKALASNDQPFHFRLYDWFMAQGKTNDLLNVKTGFLEPYLLREKPALERYDLLWQYYSRNSMFGKATGVLSALAESTDFDLDLAKRLEYLSLAASQARSQFPSAANRIEMQELLSEAEDKLEVAQVQIEIQRAIIALTDLDVDHKEAALAHINERLFNITELYSDFAEPFNLLEGMLLIFYVSDHRDPARVLDIWDALFENSSVDRSSTDVPLMMLFDSRGSVGREPLGCDRVTSCGHGAPLLSVRGGLSTACVSCHMQVSPDFPAVDLILRLEKVNMDYGSQARPGWATRVLRNAGVPFDAVFEVFDELFRSRVRPPFVGAVL
jgi:nuclear pore complex protein Nup155